MQRQYYTINDANGSRADKVQHLIQYFDGQKFTYYQNLGN